MRLCLIMTIALLDFLFISGLLNQLNESNVESVTKEVATIYRVPLYVMNNSLFFFCFIFVNKFMLQFTKDHTFAVSHSQQWLSDSFSGIYGSIYQERKVHLLLCFVDASIVVSCIKMFVRLV